MWLPWKKCASLICTFLHPFLRHSDPHHHFLFSRNMKWIVSLCGPIPFKSDPFNLILLVWRMQDFGWRGSWLINYWLFENPVCGLACWMIFYNIFWIMLAGRLLMGTALKTAVSASSSRLDTPSYRAPPGQLPHSVSSLAHHQDSCPILFLHHQMTKKAAPFCFFFTTWTAAPLKKNLLYHHQDSCPILFLITTKTAVPFLFFPPPSPRRLPHSVSPSSPRQLPHSFFIHHQDSGPIPLLHHHTATTTAPLYFFIVKPPKRLSHSVSSSPPRQLPYSVFVFFTTKKKRDFFMSLSDFAR